MKRISAIFLAILTGIAASAQYRCAIGTDLGNMITSGSVNVTAGCRINDRWSATWRIGLPADNIFRKEETEYEEHNCEFIVPYEREPILRNTSAGFQYWHYRTYEGLYLEAGIKCTADMEADCYMKLGYCMQICKGLCAVISYGTDLLSAFRNGRLSGDGPGAGIYWIIGKRQ